MVTLTDNAATKVKELMNGQAETGESAQQGNVPQALGRPRHRAFSDDALPVRERPEALARDHDAVGTSHSAEPWKVGGLVGDEQGGENLRATHRARIARRRPPDKCRAAYVS